MPQYNIIKIPTEQTLIADIPYFIPSGDNNPGGNKPYNPVVNITPQTGVSLLIEGIDTYTVNPQSLISAENAKTLSPKSFSPIKQIAPPISDYKKSSSYGIQMDQYKGQLGTPVQSYISFVAGTYSSIENNFQTITISKNWTLYNSIITCNQTKNVITNKINGRIGTVKQYMGLDDYEITIEGTVVNATPMQGVYPYQVVNGRNDDGMYTLMQFINAPIAIEIFCPFLNSLFDINYITITDYDISEKEGYYSQQKVKITAKSDNNGNLSPYNTNQFITI